MVYLGLDLSTQSLTAVIIRVNTECKVEVLHTESVNFDEEFKGYKTKNGHYYSVEEGSAIAPILMWLDAIDSLFSKLNTTGWMPQIKAICGCAQQHGTVLLTEKSSSAFQLLDNTENTLNLKNLLRKALVKDKSPIWLDKSTSSQVAHLQSTWMTDGEMFESSGAKYQHRYAAAQIRKVYEEENLKYTETAKVCVISSFLCSVLSGFLSGMDFCEASGTNLFNIHSKSWISSIDQYVAPMLESKLCAPRKCGTISGKVSPYFWKYNLDKNCQVKTFTGDNAASFVSLIGKGGQRKKRRMVISLGTSDTVCLRISGEEVERALTERLGNVSIHPLDEEKRFLLLCYSNGSITRESFVTKDWSQSTEALGTLFEKKGFKENHFGFCFLSEEITPALMRPCSKFYCCREDGVVAEVTASLDEAEMLFVCIESRFIAMLVHVSRIVNFEADISDVVLTGGASSNSCIAQIASFVFNKEVYYGNMSDGAAIGGAMLASSSVELECFPRKSTRIQEERLDESIIKEYERIETSCLKIKTR